MGGTTSTVLSNQTSACRNLTWTRGHYDAIVGRISSEWKIEGTRFFLKVAIPANTQAIIYVPSLPKRSILEGGQPSEKSSGLKFVEYRDGYAIFEAGSGNYSFESKYQK